jgi:medium-chain acyl-[acyl-carrier-protein] hydrolase
MPANIDLLPLSLPGHDGRLNEPLSTDLVILAGELSEELNRQALDRPFVLLGHSMGGLLVFEIARALRERGHAMPRLLVITGCRPPHMIVVKRQLSALPDQELIDVLQQRYGGIPPAVRDSPELQALLLPVLRADFQMIETYHYAEGPPLDVPLLVLGGTDDPAVSASDLSDWRRYTTRQCNVRLLPGAHFFLFGGDGAQLPSSGSRAAEPTPALRIILERLKQLISDSGATDGS